MANDITTYLKYANLQMAAEAFYGKKTAPAGETYVGQPTAANLTDGNDRSSKFTIVQAQQFISEGWTVVEHESNTKTGFSGTLFKNTQTGELVLSFRSTEFIDDAARDNQATNTLETRRPSTTSARPARQAGSLLLLGGLVTPRCAANSTVRPLAKPCKPPSTFFQPTSVTTLAKRANPPHLLRSISFALPSLAPSRSSPSVTAWPFSATTEPCRCRPVRTPSTASSSTTSSLR